MWEEAPGRCLWVGVVTHHGAGCTEGAPPSLPCDQPLTFFRTMNSFSAVALRAPSSSYLGVGETGAGGEGSGLGNHLSSWPSSSGAQKG